MQKHARKKKLIKPAFQLKLAGTFLAIALAAIFIQAVTLNRTMMKAAELLPNDELIFKRVWPELFFSSVLLTACLTALGVFIIGMTVTNRIAGPVYRMEVYMRELKAGRATRAYKLRKGDYLCDLADLVNDATAPLRTEPTKTTDSTGNTQDETAPRPGREAA